MAKPRYVLRNATRGYDGKAYNDLSTANRELTKAQPRAEWAVYDREANSYVGGDSPETAKAKENFIKHGPTELSDVSAKDRKGTGYELKAKFNKSWFG